MPLTRPRKTKDQYHTKTWHFEDPQVGGPFCKRPSYGDFYPCEKWPVTKNPKEVTCQRCLQRMNKEGILNNEEH